MAAIGGCLEFQSEGTDEMSEEFIKKKIEYEVAITHVDPDILPRTATICQRRRTAPAPAE